MMIALGLAAAIAASLATTAGAPARIAVAESPNPQSPVSEPFEEAVFESLCHLWIRRRALLVFTPEFTGSAVLYRGRYLLTAGHNVYQDRSRIRNVEVRCGTANARSGMVDETIEPWQAIDASGYARGPFSRDFGVIRLNRPINVAVPFGLASVSVRAGEAIRFAGYPGGPHGGWNLFAARGTVARLEDGLAYYDIETFKSNSGGPVWREVDGRPELIAIHVRKGGGGRIVDVDYLREIERLIKELDRRAAERGL